MKPEIIRNLGILAEYIGVLENFINVFIRSNNIGFVGEIFEKKVQSKPGKISTLTRGSNNFILFLSFIASS